MSEYNLRLKRKEPEKLSECDTVLTSPPPKKKKSQADYSREHRARLKENEKLYKIHRVAETVRVRNYRENRSEDAKQRNRELQRIRQANYRLNLKSKGINTQRTTKTRHAIQKEREENRERKRAYRANMSHQKRAAINQARRQKYAETKKKQLNKAAIPQVVPDSSGTNSPPSGSSLRAARSRFKNKLMVILPSRREQRVDAVTNTLSWLSPSTKKLVEAKMGVKKNKPKRRLEFESAITEAVKNQLALHKLKRRKQAISIKRLLAQTITAKQKRAAYYVGFSRKFLTKLEKHSDPNTWLEYRVKRKDALSSSALQEVTKFFEQSTVSRSLPDARSAAIKNGTVTPRRVMEMSLASAFSVFLQEKGPLVKFSTFKKLRPKHVLPFTSHKFRECLCEYCVNVDLMIPVLNSLLPADAQVKDRYNLNKLTLCATEGKKCIDRECTECGVSSIDKMICPPAQEASKICWERWENKKMNNGSQRMSKVYKEGSALDFKDALKANLLPFAKHLFNAKWQHQQYQKVTSQLPPDTVVFCMDFAENYTSRPQDAPQSCHWNNQQTTIHPVVATYACTTPDCMIPVTDSIIFISEDLTHDHHAVQHFTQEAVKLLLSEGIAFKRIISFSDGAPTQYKNRVSFVDCSHADEDLGVSAEKHFFGSRHGKGPCDREIGVIKTSVKRAVAARRAHVLTAKDFFEVTSKRLCLPPVGVDHSHTRRRFFYVGSDCIDRNRPERTSTKPMKNTQKLHCVKSVQPYVVSSRERSCFCEDCEKSQNLTCPYFHLVGEWSLQELKPMKTKKRQKRFVHFLLLMLFLF